MVLKYLLYWLAVSICGSWEGIMQSLKDTLFLLFTLPSRLTDWVEEVRDARYFFSVECYI